MNSVFVGRHLIRLDTVDSTNNYAASLVEAANFQEGTAILASWQTSGRGQRGSSWQSDNGLNLLFSLILTPVFLDARFQFDLSRCIALACYDCLSSFGIAALRIKWPNDLFAGPLKLGGILIENGIKGNRIDTSIVGIGININQQHFGELQASSLLLETGQFQSVDAVFQKICQDIERRYLQLKSGQSELIRAEYERLLFGKDELNYYAIDGIAKKCRVQGSTAEGGLILSCEDELCGPFYPRQIQLIQA